jgi:chromosome segregation ATPase
MEEHINEKKMNQEELDKLCVNRESEKQKIMDLSDELNKKRMEVNNMSMKLEILQADLSNRNQEIAQMGETIKGLREEKRTLEKELDEQGSKAERKLKEWEELIFKVNRYYLIFWEIVLREKLFVLCLVYFRINYISNFFAHQLHRIKIWSQ